MSVLTPVRPPTHERPGPAQPRHLTQPTPAQRCRLPEDVQTIPGHVRSMGISMWASKGAGKSRTLGRLIAWQDFYAGVPLVVLDPIGETTDNLLDKLVHLPPAQRIEAVPRVRYVNLAGMGDRVVPWPLYAEAYPGERVSDRAQRYVDVLERMDPQLRRASIEGMNTLSPLARAAGIVLAALGLGITEAWSLVHEPARWEPRLTHAAATHPETAAAVADLRALAALRPSDRAARQRALESKLSLFRHFPQFAAMFGATRPGIVWEEVIEQGQAVLLGFRGIDSPEHKRFCVLWVYHSLLAYLRRRGPGRHTPLSLVIDELPYLVGSAGVSTDILTTDIDELINRIARSHGVWLTIAGQELFQLPEQLRQTVLAVGTVLLGRTSDHTTAKELAERYYPYEPSCPYKIERVYGVIEDAAPGTLFHPAQPARHGAVDFRTEDVSRDGQIALNSRRFLTLPRFAFLLGVSEQEGALPTTLQQITIEDLDKEQYPDTATLAKYRAEFMRAGGVRPCSARSPGGSPREVGHDLRRHPGSAAPRRGHRPRRNPMPRARRPRLPVVPRAANPTIAGFSPNPAVLSYNTVLPSHNIQKYAYACP